MGDTHMDTHMDTWLAPELLLLLLLLLLPRLETGSYRAMTTTAATVKTWLGEGELLGRRRRCRLLLQDPGLCEGRTRALEEWQGR